MHPSISELHTVLEQADAASIKATIVNAPFKYRVEMVDMGIGIIVLLIHAKSDGQIHRVALSKTELAEGTLRISQKKFEDIKVPADHPKNIISEAIRSRQPQMTEDWQYLFTPALSPEQARLNQAGGGIACSFVYPLVFGDNDGAMIFSYFKDSIKVGADEREFMALYSQTVSGRLAADDISLDQLLRLPA